MGAASRQKCSAVRGMEHELHSRSSPTSSIVVVYERECKKGTEEKIAASI